MATMRKRSRCTPPAMLSNPSSQRFADEGGTDKKGNKLEYIRNNQGADRQFEYFVPDTVQGLTQSGLSRLNQSIKAFVYCVLGAQVNVRSSILGNGGPRRRRGTSSFSWWVQSERQIFQRAFSAIS